MTAPGVKAATNAVQSLLRTASLNRPKWRATRSSTPGSVGAASRQARAAGTRCRPRGPGRAQCWCDPSPARRASFGAVGAETGTPVDLAAVDRRLGIKLDDELAFWFPPDQIAAAAEI